MGENASLSSASICVIRGQHFLILRRAWSRNQPGYHRAALRADAADVAGQVVAAFKAEVHPTLPSVIKEPCCKKQCREGENEQRQRDDHVPASPGIGRRGQIVWAEGQGVSAWPVPPGHAIRRQTDPIGGIRRTDDTVADDQSAGSQAEFPARWHQLQWVNPNDPPVCDDQTGPPE